MSISLFPQVQLSPTQHSFRVFQLGISSVLFLGLTQRRSKQFESSYIHKHTFKMATCKPTVVLLGGADISMLVGWQQNSTGSGTNGLDLQALAGWRRVASPRHFWKQWKTMASVLWLSFSYLPVAVLCLPWTLQMFWAVMLWQSRSQWRSTQVLGEITETENPSKVKATCGETGQWKNGISSTLKVWPLTTTETSQ